ncbi:flagellar assembly protein FliW [Paenibacillus sp. YIM B09110]|uniref:flagellar assembly protein FliW n=1 Tax=Paenibacillus sp. YIM B09110 TaxID=3126102 RepID=UPI00301C3A68
MLIESTRFGNFKYEEADIITFQQGIPGFKHLRKYILIEIAESPFYYLQSLEDGAVTFITATPFDFYENYEFDLPDHIKAELELTDEAYVRVVSIVSIQDDLAKATINLTAPIVINGSKQFGLQYILSDNKYSIRQPLFLEHGNQDGGK